MTRIDFYILPEGGTSAHEAVSCRLVEKVYKLGMNVYIHTDSEQLSQELDDLLWTFRQGSFIPHAQHGAEAAVESPVVVGHCPEPGTEHHDVLINFAQEVPAFFGRFERVAELVDQQPDYLQQARARYTFYRERGYELQSHKLKG